MLGMISGLLQGVVQSWKAPPAHGARAMLCTYSVEMQCNRKALRARKSRVYAAHARLSSQLVCAYYFQGHTFSYPPQSVRLLPPKRMHRRWWRGWWREIVRKLYKSQRRCRRCLKVMFKLA